VHAVAHFDPARSGGRRVLRDRMRTGKKIEQAEQIELVRQGVWKEIEVFLGVKAVRSKRSHAGCCDRSLKGGGG
jgi:hypothetical protein